MAYVGKLFNVNFLEYASYVIKDRAIPDLIDGLKPVQRRIIHSLFEMDDSKFHKVANVVGHCMKYHPHGDASIYSALVVLANKELFIDKQGNFGNVLTGDEPSAARYIECRILPFAKKVLYSPEITQYQDSYDSRNREPVVFQAKIPVILIQGAEGIAVGMSTKILPHNFHEVLEALKAALKGESFKLYPDFPGGGFIDVSDYQDGLGRVLTRAKLDTSDPKRIIIREIPFGTTTESLIASIEAAARKNKVRIAGIYDYTTENVEIEIKLSRGVHTQDVLDELYAFTDCEYSISVNLLVIVKNTPQVMTASEVIQYHAKHLVIILTKELKIEEQHLLDRHHARTLERIFIEERVYKDIEEMTTQETVIEAVLEGFKPFHDQIKRDVTREDVERLLKIPIRRISLYDINKAKQEMEEIQARLKEVRHHLKNIVSYAAASIDALIKEKQGSFHRKTEIISFEKTDVKDVADRDLELVYHSENGYLGHGLNKGNGDQNWRKICMVSSYDRVLVIRNDGSYSVIDAPERLFVGQGMLFCGIAGKEKLKDTVFTIVYKEKESGLVYIKRCSIEKYILDKKYRLVPAESSILAFTTRQDTVIEVVYKPKPRLKKLEEQFVVQDYLVKNVKANGVRLTAKEVKKLKLIKGALQDKPDKKQNTKSSKSNKPKKK